jgi:hypothetical protein
MQCLRRYLVVLMFCLFSVVGFAPSNASAAARPQAGSAAGSSAPTTPSTPPAPQAAAVPAQEGGTTASAKPAADPAPADAQKVAPPKENEGGYRDPDWGPRRELKPALRAAAFTGTYQPGEVFASDGSGDVVIFQPDGTMIGTLVSGQPLTAGMAFDRLGNLYVSTFGVPPGVVKFDMNGNLIGPFGNFPVADTGTALPESVLISQAGNVFVGAATVNFSCPAALTGPVPAFEFGPDGTLLNTFILAGECRGTDWVELLADQKTLLYTSEGTTVQSFDTSANKQNAPFATGLPGSSAFAFRQLPDGTVLVADSTAAVRLRADGSVLATYTPNPAVSELFALNLDPDGTSFWTADLLTGAIFRFDIASGTQLTTFTSPTGEASGLAIFGEKITGNNNLTVTVNGTGTGTVTSTPAGLSCPTMCVAAFPDNSSVTLTATAAAGSTLASFSTNCVPANPQTTPPTCTVPIVTSDVTVTATFNTGTNVALTVTEAGTGTGTVTSTPTGITCPTTCAASFASGTMVTLTEVAATGSTFAGWSGACTGTGACVVTVTAAAAVTATFTAANTFALTVTKAGTGTGTVTSMPAGINCGTACTANFASGTQIILTATPAAGSTFAGWGAGPCEGTGMCTLTITAATTVAANFTAGTNNFTLTVTEAGTGSGNVNSTPAGIICPETCAASFASGTQVTLMQSASDGSVFSGWSGACTGTAACVVSMTAAKAVTATFNSSNSQVIITVPSGGSTTASTTPGGTAFFGLLISGAQGVTGTVQLSCASPSTFITCTVIPSTITLTGGTTEVAFGIQTFCKGTSTTAGSVPGGAGGGMAMMLMTLMCGGIGMVSRRKRGGAMAFAMVLIMVAMGIGACGSLPTSPTGQATPPGTYSISLTTTFKGNVQTLPNFLTLVVK